MEVQPTRDRRAERREATRAEILEAAWELARQHGLAGLTLRDVANRIGMRPPSLYWYFDSKNAVYDAMFAEGNRVLLSRMATQVWPSEPRALLRAMATLFVTYSVEDPARAQLLFQRTIPDFEPSPASYAIAQEVWDGGMSLLASVGITDQQNLDLWTALSAGLSAQQLANDPVGTRWIGLIDKAAEMFADFVLKPPTKKR